MQQAISATTILLTLGSYFVLLIVISLLTSRNTSKESFFTGDKQSPWFLVAFGMIGASLSGVTFISVPGKVGVSFFSYFLIVIGYVLGYVVIAEILLPLYYRLKLISIYEYLEKRYGIYAYKTGASFFILSRVIGASFRLFLVAGVLQVFVFANPVFFDVPLPFWVSVLIAVLLIWVYTFKAGIKTIVWTDTLQTAFMIGAVVLAIYSIADSMGLTVFESVEKVFSSELSSFTMTDSGEVNIFKSLLTGMFITIVMTGLDQDMMQKNLTIRTIGEAKKNMYVFAGVLVLVNLVFLVLGAMLFQYANFKGVAIPSASDELFPTLALNHFNVITAVVFLLGVISAAYSSADSALTALTTSFSLDILGKKPETMKSKDRYLIHFVFSLVLFVVIILFSLAKDQAVIDRLFAAAGYTYGPLLGLFAFGLSNKRIVRDGYIPSICLIAAVFSFGLNEYLSLHWDINFGFNILFINAGVTMLGLLAFSRSK